MQQASLVIVGTGIKSFSHLTNETIAYIKNSDLVLYSLNEPLMAEWIRKTNTNSKSLDDEISEEIRRIDNYTRITNYIVSAVKEFQHVCVVFYGHPTVFAKSALDAAKLLKCSGFKTYIFPGISAEACLFADLYIDPGSHGLMSYEATDMLLRKKMIDVCSHLIIWQVGLIGAFGSIHEYNNHRITILKKYLQQFYSDEHAMIAYEAALYPHTNPRIENFMLKNIDTVQLTSLTTLYVPPIKKNEINKEMLIALECS